MCRSRKSNPREHLDDDGEPLIHLQSADLFRAAIRFFHAGDLEVERRLVRFIDLALRQGDAAVQNAVVVSFVENIWAYPQETGFIASWPSGPRAELDEQGG